MGESDGLIGRIPVTFGHLSLGIQLPSWEYEELGIVQGERQTGFTNMEAVLDEMTAARTSIESGDGGFQRCDVDLLHRHHRLHCALSLVTVRAGGQLEQPLRQWSVKLARRGTLIVDVSTPVMLSSTIPACHPV